MPVHTYQVLGAMMIVILTSASSGEVNRIGSSARRSGSLRLKIILWCFFQSICLMLFSKHLFDAYSKHLLLIPSMCCSFKTFDAYSKDKARDLLDKCLELYQSVTFISISIPIPKYVRRKNSIQINYVQIFTKIIYSNIQMFIKLWGMSNCLSIKSPVPGVGQGSLAVLTATHLGKNF